MSCKNLSRTISLQISVHHTISSTQCGITAGICIRRSIASLICLTVGKLIALSCQILYGISIGATALEQRRNIMYTGIFQLILIDRELVVLSDRNTDLGKHSCILCRETDHAHRLL